MATTRKSRSANKRFAKVNEERPFKDGRNSNKNRPRKRKLSDMLGPQWSKEELERFYEAYRKYGKNWKKVAGVTRNRSLEMVEALYNMSKAFLSLPEGVATAAGLIAMMTDHYNVLEGSDSERESNEVPRTSQKTQRSARGKYSLMSEGSEGAYPHLLHLESASSSYACLSSLKKKRSGDQLPGNQPHAVGKRTPRIPVRNTYTKEDRDKIVSFGKCSSKCENTTVADKGVHVTTLALAEASQKGGSPRVSRTPGRRAGHLGHSPVHNGERKDAESDMEDLKTVGVLDPEVSLGSREVENGYFIKEVSYLIDTGRGSRYEMHQKDKKLQGKISKEARGENEHFDDDKESCYGTEEGLNIRRRKDEFDMELTDSRTALTFKGSRKRSRRLFSDESNAFDALQTLADLSVHILLPSSAVDSASSIQVRDEKRNADCSEKSSMPKSMSTNYPSDRSKVAERKDRVHSSALEVDAVTQTSGKIAKNIVHDANVSTEVDQQNCASTSRIQRRKRMLTGKISKSEFDSTLNETQKMEEFISSATDKERGVIDSNKMNVQISTINQLSLQTKVRCRWKLELQETLAGKESKPYESVGDDNPNIHPLQVNSRALESEDFFSHCISSRLLRRWCVFEWFYSAIDYPWFTKTEFLDYLNHVKLCHVPRLTRLEWGVIRSSLGKPRRFSSKFLQEERDKLEQYRESVRTHYAELRAGVKEELPSDMARPLSVGQRVSACHPKTREIHDGSVLTVDCTRYRVQFDLSELGVEFVMDVDCMPLNQLDKMPEALRRQNVGIYKFCNSFKHIMLEGQPKEKLEISTKSAPNESLAIADGTSCISSPNYSTIILMEQAKGDKIDAVAQAKTAVNEVFASAGQTAHSQPWAQTQADISAINALEIALNKKEALLLTLRHLHEEVSGNQKYSSRISDLESFRMHYAMVLLQLGDANDQVATALLNVRQRNTYPGHSTPPMHKFIESSASPVAHQASFNSVHRSLDPESNILQIVRSSRQKARTMVDVSLVSLQATCGLNEGEDPYINRIVAALDLNNTNSNSTYPDSAISCNFEGTAGSILSPKPNISFNGNKQQFPADMISNCMATLLMIQNCAENQYPPGEIAQVIDSAVSSLHPSCPKNLPVYREIETCMGIIKHQILALIRTPATYSAEASMA